MWISPRLRSRNRAPSSWPFIGPRRFHALWLLVVLLILVMGVPAAGRAMTVDRGPVSSTWFEAALSGQRGQDVDRFAGEPGGTARAPRGIHPSDGASPSDDVDRGGELAATADADPDGGPPVEAEGRPVPGAERTETGRGGDLDRTGRWTWPLTPTPTVVLPFRAPVERWSAGHRGVDLRPAGAPPSADAPDREDGHVDRLVLAPADGVVVFAGTVVDRGVLSIDHAAGLRSSFEPVRALVPVGTLVRRGTPVAVIAEGGQHCAGCVHWGVRRAGEYLDPLSLLMPRRTPVLLPLRR